MKRFIALYFLFLALLFTLFYANTSIISTLINDGQTKLTLTFLKLFLKPGQLQGIDIWIDPHYKIIINQACNGMIPLLMLWAALLAYPASWLHKASWMLVGYAVMIILNIIRILMVVAVTMDHGQSAFYWIHDILGNALLMGGGLGVFILFIKSTSNKNSSYSST
jgi:exosortase/archaeosortase family protein